jgi:hypothetical protein
MVGVTIPWLLKNSIFVKTAEIWGIENVGKPRESFVGLRSAKFFRSFSRARVFQQPRLIAGVTPSSDRYLRSPQN